MSIVINSTCIVTLSFTAFPYVSDCCFGFPAYKLSSVSYSKHTRWLILSPGCKTKLATTC